MPEPPTRGRKAGRKPAREPATPPGGAPELELCFSVTASQREPLRRALATRGTPPRPVEMRARYFDTPDGDLAAAGMALRVRREGRRWVQTLKTTAAGELARTEYETARPDGTLDFDALSGTPAASVLAHAGLDGRDALALVHETSIRRTLRTIRTRGAVVEIAFDEGTIAAQGRRLRVREVEFELVRGAPSALFEFAARWQRRFGLATEPRSKAERGHALRLGRAAEPPRKAAPVALPRSASPLAALRAAALECADQIQRNTATLARGEGGGEHVHQCRVGLRRLRSAWRFFAPWTPAPPASLVDGARALFARLGECRDAEVQASGPRSMMLEAGMPERDAPATAGAVRARALAEARAREIAADQDAQAWILQLLAWIDGLAGALPVAPAGPGKVAGEPGAKPVPVATDPLPPGPSLRRRLRDWHRAVAIDEVRFSLLEPEERHALRKRAKRLRYATEFCAALLEPAALRRYLQRLGRLQDALGELNDLAVAEAALASPAPDDAASWFARGWLAARSSEVARDAGDALRRLPAKPPRLVARGGRRR